MECAEVAARLHARGGLEVFKTVEDLRSRVDVRSSTLGAVDAHLPLGAISFPSPAAHSMTSPSVVLSLTLFSGVTTTDWTVL